MEEVPKELSIEGKLIHQVFEFTRIFISEREAKELIALVKSNEENDETAKSIK